MAVGRRKRNTSVVCLCQCYSHQHTAGRFRDAWTKTRRASMELDAEKAMLKDSTAVLEQYLL